MAESRADKMRITKIMDDHKVTIPPHIRTFLKVGVGDYIVWSLGYKEVIVKKAGALG